MNKIINDIIRKNNLHPISYQKIKSVYLVKTNDKSYIIKLNTNNYDIYKYLLSRDFPYFPENYTLENDNYDISLFVIDKSLDVSQKINDYIKLLAMLHKKTSYRREIDLDEIKEEYEKIREKIISLHEYYYKLNDKIDQELFFSPAMYLLVRNISLIFNILDNSLFLLDREYENLKNKKSIRVALLHNNIDLDHLIINDNKYLISWDKAYFANPIYDLELFYRKYFSKIEIVDFLNIYETINKLSDSERIMLIIILSLPKKIELSNDTMKDTSIIHDEINYLNKLYNEIVNLKNSLINY